MRRNLYKLIAITLALAILVAACLALASCDKKDDPAKLWAGINQASAKTEEAPVLEVRAIFSQGVKLPEGYMVLDTDVVYDLTITDWEDPDERILSAWSDLFAGTVCAQGDEVYWARTHFDILPVSLDEMGLTPDAIHAATRPLAADWQATIKSRHTLSAQYYGDRATYTIQVYDYAEYLDELLGDAKSLMDAELQSYAVHPEETLVLEVETRAGRLSAIRINVFVYSAHLITQDWITIEMYEHVGKPIDNHRARYTLELTYNYPDEETVILPYWWEWPQDRY